MRGTGFSETDPIMQGNDSGAEQHVDLLEEHQIHSGLNQRGGQPFHQEKFPTILRFLYAIFPFNNIGPRLRETRWYRHQVIEKEL